MSTVAVDHRSLEASSPRRAAFVFGASILLVACAACLAAGWFPLGVSIVTVFLFAGPHNWMEARYLMSRMPPRWGALRPFFLTGIIGVVTLTGLFAALPWLGHWNEWSHENWLTAMAGWNTLLVAWIVALAQMRSRQNPRREWSWMIPAGFALVGLNWLSPQAWDLGLVYLHPLMALWFLDREIAKRRPTWRGAYRVFLAALPVMLLVLWSQLGSLPPLPGDDVLTARITSHAGADILSGISSRVLVATHVFLEMLHYGVWLVMIPLVSMEGAPWKLNAIPLARRSSFWKRTLAAVLALGATVVVLFWVGFVADYPLTRDIYFTVAMFHVLAEVPFLLRLL